MPFTPRHDHHSIAEVAFALSLDAKPSEEKFRAFLDTYQSDWQDDFPINEEITGRTLQLTQALQSQPSFGDAELSGFRFKTLQRDGSLDWQVRVEDRQIIVNCGSYSRWANVWPTARGYMTRLADFFVDSNHRIASVGLQVIDEFFWNEDPKEYDISQLLNTDSDLFLGKLKNVGPMWHLHSGWFTSEDLIPDGKLLEKIHMDAFEGNLNSKLVYVTRIDVTLRHDFDKPVNELTSLQHSIDDLFSDMHKKNKSFLSSALSNEMAERISLNE